MATHQHVRAAIYRLREKYNKQGISPRSINCGNCDSFAEELERKFPEGKAIWGDDYPEFFTNGVDPEGHCFFEFKKRYYDSECPWGKNSPEQLPFYIRQKSFKEPICA